MMQTDVKATACAAGTSTTAFNGRARVKAIALSYTGSAGACTITDGNGGSTVFTLTPPGGVSGTLYMLLPGEGILCSTSIYVTNGSGTTASVFYG